MMLYIDDDGASPRLAKLLRQAGHDVVLPSDVGMAGKKDPVHFAFAVRAKRVLLTIRDFSRCVWTTTRSGTSNLTKSSALFKSSSPPVRSLTIIIMS